LGPLHRAEGGWASLASGRSAGDEPASPGLERGQVAGLPGEGRPTAENPLIGEERSQRHCPDPDLDGPRPVEPGDVPLDQAGEQQGEDQPYSDRHQRPGVLGERLTPTARPGRDPGPEDAQASGTGYEDGVQLELAVRGDVEEE